MFLLKVICCIGGTIILAGDVETFMRWWARQPIVEVKEPPLYITRTYNDIINEYND